MNLEEIFKSDKVVLPRAGYRDGKQTFDRFLAKLFQEYVALVGDLSDAEFPAICDGATRSMAKAGKLASGIVRAVRRYLEGSPHRAYAEVEGSLRSAGIDKLTTILSGFSATDPAEPPRDLFLECTLHPPLYRMRSNRKAAAGTLKAKDIFHVPFESRRLVGIQRYSVVGLPCLYLGSSILVSWEELGRPELDGTFVSRFRFAEKTSVLDFQFPPLVTWLVFKHAHERASNPNQTKATIELRAHYDDTFLASYIEFWPLIAACSIKLESREGSFFPQYIIPQLLLQWVTKEQKVDGIRYFSTHPAPIDVYAYTNCVFPARRITLSGQCSYLKRKFHLTTPVPWEILQSLDFQDRFIVGPANAQAAFKLNDDLMVPYSKTGFYRAEATLGWIESQPSGSKAVED